MCRYQHCIDTLEGLVVARIFELTKMNRSQTGELPAFINWYILMFYCILGYALCKHIAEALQKQPPPFVQLSSTTTLQPKPSTLLAPL
jgi:hypothetical protein